MRSCCDCGELGLRRFVERRRHFFVTIAESSCGRNARRMGKIRAKTRYRSRGNACETDVQSSQVEHVCWRLVWEAVDALWPQVNSASDLLRAERLTVDTGLRTAALHSLKVGSGDILELCGETGVGKTHLAMHLSALASHIFDRVLYFETEKRLSTSRFKEIVARLAPGLTSKVHVIPITGLQEVGK